MKIANRRVAGIAAVSALAITLSACGQDAVQTDDGAATGGATTGTSEELSGALAGAGASSQEAGQNAWVAEFSTQNSGLTLSYDPTGSGAGREQFINGTVQFAGSDAAFKPEEIEAATERCYGAEPLELPLWVSPIAVVFNLPGIETLNMTPDTIARVFTGEITSWNDPAIADANPGVELPDSAVVAVNRSDDPGTTENFTANLDAVAPDVWTYGGDGVWPIEGTQSGAQTSGVLEVVNGAEGTIAYVDASRVGDLGTVAVGVGDEFVPYSAEAAARVLEVSEPTEDASDLRLTYELARDTTESGTYPIVLVSYMIACSQYDNEADATNVAAYFSYIASEEGQELAAQADVAGIAPISDSLREKVTAAIDQISAG